MPRDKSVSHIKVNKAIKEEFLEKGFEAASVRSIGARAGMTSAGLYRHYVDKEAMFDAMVEPLISSIEEWVKNHKRKKYAMLEEKSMEGELFGETFMDLIREVILPNRDEFKLLMECSAGTKYENFIHDFVVENQKEYMNVIGRMKKMGYPAVDIDEAELHVLLSAYLTACFEPIIDNYSIAKIEKYLKTVHEFFMPGWRKIMGIN